MVYFFSFTIFFSSDLLIENRIDLELDHSQVQLFSNIMCNKFNPVLSLVVSEPLESLGDSISTAVVLSWGKEAGEAIAESDVIATVETDKVTMDIRAKKAGVFVEGLVPVKGEVCLLFVLLSSSILFFYSVILFFTPVGYCGSTFLQNGHRCHRQCRCFRS
jgi:hypothetical protein